MAKRKWKWDGKTAPDPDFVGSRQELQEDVYDEYDDQPEEGDIRVWWIQSVPSYGNTMWWMLGNKRGNLTRALSILVRMEITDLQKQWITDNAGGIEVFEGGDWSDWYHPETGDDSDEYLQKHRARIENRLGIRKPKKRKKVA